MAELIEIDGGVPLRGTIRVGGAKNAALPLLIASLLTGEECTFRNVPLLEDVSLTFHLLEHFGAECSFSGGVAKVSVPRLVATEASYSLVKALRASFWVLAPLLARGRAARVALPGGDIIGARPVDMHIDGLVRMGADISVKHGVVYASAPHGLKPVEIDFRFPSVGATHQLIMAAALTPGTSVIRGAAKEPEIVALAELINGMGGDVEGAGSSEIIIRGKEELGGGDITLIGDRIEAGTYLLAAGITGGEVRLEGIRPAFFGAFLEVVDQMGISLTTGENFVEVRGPARLRPVRVTTGPFPELATDLQAPLMAALTVADGESTIDEKVFEGRFGHVSELCRMGAQIRVSGQSVQITGIERLTGAPVDGLDIRAAACLVVAGLQADGVTQLYEPHHIRRGYEMLESKLRGVGGRVWARVSDPDDFMFTGC